MPISISALGRGDAAGMIQALQGWSAPGCYAAGLHAGDLGWHLRLDDDQVDGSILCVEDGAEIVATGIIDGPDCVFPVIKPDRLYDVQLAETLAEFVCAAPSEVYAEAAPQSAFRSVLSARGWVIDPDAWLVLYRGLTAADGVALDEQVSPLASESDIADRVAVQRSAFEGSTFTVKRWQQMAAGPGYDVTLDLLRRNGRGEAVAAATGWSAGPGKCGILEPVGTSADHAGVGHGRAVSSAVMAALARAGASGVAVHTPASNVAAVTTYERCGMRRIETTNAMLRCARSA